MEIDNDNESLLPFVENVPFEAEKSSPPPAWTAADHAKAKDKLCEVAFLRMNLETQLEQALNNNDYVKAAELKPELSQAIQQENRIRSLIDNGRLDEVDSSLNSHGPNQDLDNTSLIRMETSVRSSARHVLVDSPEPNFLTQGSQGPVHPMPNPTSGGLFKGMTLMNLYIRLSGRVTPFIRQFLHDSPRLLVSAVCVFSNDRHK